MIPFLWGKRPVQPCTVILRFNPLGTAAAMGVLVGWDTEVEQSPVKAWRCDLNAT